LAVITNTMCALCNTECGMICKTNTTLANYGPHMARTATIIQWTICSLLHKTVISALSQSRNHRGRTR